MSIRIGNSCLNCENFQLDHTCSVHHVKVSEKYTCNSFEMKNEVKIKSIYQKNYLLYLNPYINLYF